jgi:uncharacterized OB-fold protein
MPYFDSASLVPEPGFDDRPFWEACDQRRLVFQCCARCLTKRHPPTPVCPRCRSLEVAWQPTQGRGEVFTFTVVHHASHESVISRLPYVVAVVVFDDAPEVRLVTNVTGLAPAAVQIGLRVQVWWDEVAPGRFVPRCEPEAAS